MKNLMQFVLKVVTYSLLFLTFHQSNAQTKYIKKNDLPLFLSKENKMSNQTTKFGVLPSKGAVDIRLTTANNLFSEYVRDNITLSAWNGVKNSDIDYWIDHGKKVILNINNDFTPSPFPTNLVEYESKLRSVLNVYAGLVELVVIENEELQQYELGTTSTLYHTGSLMDYINEISVASSVCTEFGVPVTNGGLTSAVVSSLRNYYDENGKADSALWLTQALNGVDMDPNRILRADSLLEAYSTLPLSYVNLHWYEPQSGDTATVNIIKAVCDYISQQTGKKVISNETGTKTTDSSIITSMMRQWDSVGVDYCIFWDGVGSEGALPLTTQTGILLDNGIAFRDYLFGSPSCVSTFSVSPEGPITVCDGEVVTLSAPTGYGNYLWSNGAATRIINTTTPGNYTVVSNQGGCTVYATNTIVVEVDTLPAKPTISANNSTSNVCPTKTVQLSSSPASGYLWSTGQTTKFINVNQGSYTVTITDNNGCSNTSNAQIVTAQPCLRATNLSTSNIDKFKVTFNWDTAVCAIGYQLQYRIKGTLPWTSTDVNGGKTSSKTIFNLTLSTTYQWRIVTGCRITPDTVASTYAIGPEFQTLGNTTPCNTPSNLNVSNIELNKATLNWNAQANSNGYEIQYRVKNSGEWTVVNITGGTQSLRTIYSLTLNTTYEWKMRTTCQNAADTISQFTNGPDFTTLGYIDPCNPPTNLNVTSIELNKATLNWDAVLNSNGYEIQYRKIGVGAWTIIEIANGTSTTRTIYSLDINSTYEWKMRSTCQNAADTISGFFNGPYFTTLGYTDPCNAPSNLNVTNIEKFKATLNWNVASNSIGYELEYRVKNVGAWTIVNILSSAQTSRTINSLTAATTYEWRIRTKCSNAADTLSIYALGPDFTTLAASLSFSKTQKNNGTQGDRIIANLYPNPASDIASLTLEHLGTNLHISLSDMNGRILWKREKINEKNVLIPISKLANGVYCITITDEKNIKVLKLIKQ